LNDKRVQQILAIEQQAQAIYDAAVREAEQLPVQAEKEAQALIEQARTEAQDEARQLVANAQAQEECAHILTQAETNAKQMEAAAASHFDHAVSYVLNQVAARE